MQPAAVPPSLTGSTFRVTAARHPEWRRHSWSSTTLDVVSGHVTRVGHSVLKDYELAVRSSTGQLSESELIRHAESMCTHGFQNEAVPLLEEYLTRFAARADVVRLKLAEVAIKTQQRPQYGLRVLNELPAGALKPRYEILRQALADNARAMIADGVLELSGRAW